ncbi:MAG TPA: antibiotic biosynthesis monooxygenase family protein [Acidobacteriota bacterium]|nr:antibiotic biosynthesis monooxygenase family protein [Acidobacteriota bacterium]
MSITRINIFQAQEGKERELRQLIKSFLPLIESSQGCLSCALLQRQDDPARLLVIEEWENAEAHRAAASQIPADTLEKAREILAAPPSGAFYRQL